MAKRKGKSQHRQKGWERIRRLGEIAGDDTESRRRLTQRRIRLPGQEQDAPIYSPAEPADPGENVTGEVVQLYPGGAIVRCAQYGELLGQLAGTFRPAPNSSALAVGDEVVTELTPEARGLIQAGEFHLDFNRVDALILQRAPRRTALSRPQPTSEKRRDRYENDVFEKVIAANMDQLVVVAAAQQPKLRRHLLDRYLIVAERGEMPCRLVVNKIDLGEVDAALLEQYAALGMPSLLVSAATGEGLEELRALLAGKRSIFAGASGVGKSSLLNRLVPELNLTTREVRRSDNRGRHTTTSAVLYPLPFGGEVVDTPGIRELGIEIDRSVLPWYFPEFTDLSPHCKFRDCTHTHEPQCAVRDAVEAEQVPLRRYESYLRLLESLET